MTRPDPEGFGTITDLEADDDLLDRAASALAASMIVDPSPNDSLTPKLTLEELEQYVEELEALRTSYDFHVTREDVVYALRSLADEIEQGSLV